MNLVTISCLSGIDECMHAEACMQVHGTSMHCGSQVAADSHLMHSTGHKNFAGRRSLEKLYGWTQSGFSKQPEDEMIRLIFHLENFPLSGRVVQILIYQ